MDSSHQLNTYLKDLHPSPDFAGLLVSVHLWTLLEGRAGALLRPHHRLKLGEVRGQWAKRTWGMSKEEIRLSAELGSASFVLLWVETSSVLSEPKFPPSRKWVPRE